MSKFKIRDFLPHKERNRGGSNSSNWRGGGVVGAWDDFDYDMNWISFVKKNCQKYHLAGIPMWAGRVYGYPGIYHDDHRHDINVWLAGTGYQPSGMYTRGMKTFEESEKLDIFFPVPDQGVPENVDEFYKLIQILVDFLKKGKEVAISCVGGHGRTGLLIALLYGVFNKETLDPIASIRAKGCHHWVESEAQARFIFAALRLTYNNKYNRKVVIVKPQSKKETPKDVNNSQKLSSNPGDTPPHNGTESVRI